MGAVAVWLMTALGVAASALNAETPHPAPSAPSAPSVLVWDLEAEEGIAPALTAAMGAELVLALRDAGTFERVLAQSDVTDLLARTPGPLRDGCVACVLALESALKVDRVVVGRLRRLGTQMSLELKLLDVHRARVVAATHELLTDDAAQLVKGMRTRAARLLMEETRRALEDALDAALDGDPVAPEPAPTPPAPAANVPPPPALTPSETPPPAH